MEEDETKSLDAEAVVSNHLGKCQISLFHQSFGNLKLEDIDLHIAHRCLSVSSY